ncbi:minor tail protein [Mycobacterium phage Trixie]|uniref:Glycine-rich domain-containing protein n=1 Tax=Mycobacterium phage Trixie TaxID=1071503 RepID=G1JV60_9CAUD|nr:minor tail protein [Mycobacterium phage Trixie]AEL17840.1 hypothetical protein TRIXIE_8 [Mycobacterium phage Trixie]
MAIYLGSTALTTFRVGTETPDRIFLGNELVWPPFTATTMQFTSAGTFTIPANCRFIDVILLGAGGGGAGGNAVNGDGQGGKAGTWQTATIKRGVDIGWSVTQITVGIGVGGAGGSGGASSGSGSGGGQTYVVATGFSLLANGGAGGVGSNPAGGNTTFGQGVTPIVFNGLQYVGGGQSGADNNPDNATNGAPGNPPGGGGEGGGGVPFIGTPGRGGVGGNGSAWLRAY